MGIAIGPRTWFGEKFGDNVSSSGVVTNNKFSGAFTYGIAVSSAVNFTVQDNILLGNTSFIGARGPNCSDSDSPPAGAPFIVDSNNTDEMNIQPNFQSIGDGDDLTCVLPPNGGDFWPFGTNPSNTTQPGESQTGPHGHGLSSGAKAGIAIGVILGVVFIGVATWFIRKQIVKRVKSRQLASQDSY